MSLSRKKNTSNSLIDTVYWLVLKKQIVAENEKKVSKYVGSIDYPCMLNC